MPEEKVEFSIEDYKTMIAEKDVYIKELEHRVRYLQATEKDISTHFKRIADDAYKSSCEAWAQIPALREAARIAESTLRDFVEQNGLMGKIMVAIRPLIEEELDARANW